MFGIFQRRPEQEPSPRQRQWQWVHQLREEVLQGRFDEAFAKGEALLDEHPCAEIYEALAILVEHDLGSTRRPVLYSLLERIERERATSHLPWRRYLRYVLLDRLRWGEDAFVATAEFREFPERYGWMRDVRGTALLNHSWAFSDAAKEFEAAYRSAPQFWKAAARQAECLLFLGDEAGAYAVFDQCLAEIPKWDNDEDFPKAVVWRGELKLWTGRYKDALDDLNGVADDVRYRATRPGLPQLALGWRGAARLQLGDTAGAIVDLDEALKLWANDTEALNWRGEAYARLGNLEAAARDFDSAIEKTRDDPLWPLLGRALLRAQRGDVAGLWADFDALPARITGYFGWQLAKTERTPENAVATLEAIRTAACGCRRSETHLFAMWTRRFWMHGPAPQPDKKPS